MTKQQKVSIEQIDRLRAGLLDQTPHIKDEVEAALHADQNLAAENGRWERIRQQLDATEDNDIRSKNQLRLRRRSVLSGKAGRKPRRFTLPQMALATASGIALTLSAVLWFSYQPQSTVVIKTGVDSADDIVFRSAAEADGEFDLTNNVDFYVWMEKNELLIEEPDNGT